MKFLTITVVAALAAVSLPFAVAAPDDCPDPSPLFVEHPQSDEDDVRYLFLDAREPEKLGEWVESNGVVGLQTSLCLKADVYEYFEDTYVPFLA